MDLFVSNRLYFFLVLRQTSLLVFRVSSSILLECLVLQLTEKKGAITIICKLFALASCSTDYILSLCYICSFMSLVIYFFPLLASCGIARIYSMYNLRMVITYSNSFDALYIKVCNIMKKKLKFNRAASTHDAPPIPVFSHPSRHLQ